MDKPVEITNSEWTEVVKRKEAIDVIETRLNRHSERLDKLEAHQIKAPQEISKAINDSLTPITESIKELMEENNNLRAELKELENSKYKEAYKSLKHVTYTLAGVIITYFVTMLLNNVLG